MPQITADLQRCYTAVVNDTMRSMGLKDFILPRRLQPIMPEKVIAGPVFTISGRSVGNADAHHTLLEWTALLSKAKPGHIWLAQPNDQSVAQMGELSAEALQNKGVLAVVTDGLIRDTQFLLSLEFQTWCSGTTPADVVGRWLPDGFDVPIKIGEVNILPGDYLLGDRDGLIRLPRDLCREIIDVSLTSIAAENSVRNAILAGVDPQQAYLKYGKF